MRIYDPSGYVNVKGILDCGYPFNFLVGGRGTGKTYTTLKTAKEEGRKFMLMRRTQSQADLISKPEFSVFKPLNEDLGWNVMVHRMITLGTFEEKIDEMLKSKKELADLAVYEGEKIITELSDEEIYEIFSLSAG